MLKELSGRFSLWRLPDVQRILLLTVLAFDIVLLGLFLRWAYVEHDHIASRFLGDLRYSLVDGSYSETFGYLQQAVIVAVLLGLWRRRGDLLYLGFALLFLTTLMDDSLKLHEHMAHHAGGLLHLSHPSQSRSEVAAFGLLGILPSLVILAGYRRAGAAARRDGEVLAIGFGILFFFAVVADWIHEKVVTATGRHDTILSLFEDGGELLAMTLILGVALRLRHLSQLACPRAGSSARIGVSLPRATGRAGPGGRKPL